MRFTKIKINKKFLQSLNFSPMQVKGFIGRELPTYMHGRKRSGDDNYTQWGGRWGKTKPKGRKRWANQKQKRSLIGEVGRSQSLS